MPIVFQINEKDDAVLITVTGDIDDDEITQMRVQTLETLNETGIHNFVVDMSEMTSFLERDTLKTYESGKEFAEMKFPLSMKTAIILPKDNKVTKQAKFLHTVEVNRARPPIKYVASYEEALAWFRE